MAEVTLSTPVVTIVSTVTFTADLPAGTAEKLLVVALDAGTTGIDLTTPTGWVKLGPWESPVGAPATFLTVFYSNGDTSETSVTLTTSTKDELGATAGYIVTGGDLASTAQGAAMVGTGSTPDPPSVALSGGDGLVLAVFSADNGVNIISAYPSGYTYRTDEFRDNNASGATGGLAALQVTSGTSADPGAFTISGSDEWAAQTLFIPSAVTTPPQETPTGLGVIQEGNGLRASWTSGEGEFVLERERWAGEGEPV